MITQEQMIKVLGERYTDQSLLREYIERCLYDVIEYAKAELEACKSENFNIENYKYCSQRLEDAMSSMRNEREMLRNPNGKNLGFFRRVIEDTHNRVREKAYKELIEKQEEE